MWVVIAIVLAVTLAVCLFILWRLIQQRNSRASDIDQQHMADLAELRSQAKVAASEIRMDATRALDQARERSAEILADAERRREEVEASLETQRAELRTLRKTHERREVRLSEREDRVAADAEALTARAQRQDALRARLIDEQRAVDLAQEQVAAELERVAGLTQEQARKDVMAAAEHGARLAATSLAREIETTAKREAEKVGRSIIVGAIQRLASEQTSESVVSAVDLPSDEMKGRIIGREGRNIRAFEQVTGVNVLIDDTPESVLLSCFDPVRRETARLTLIDLVTDGRIHPARIEEVYVRNVARVQERSQRAAEDALAEVGITDLHPDLIPILGTLTYRTSYGQNVLRHLVECAHLAGMMAAELGLDVAVCKRAAFLHDIGKALTHEVEGSHALIGAELARKYGESPDIVHAIEAHHNEVPPATVEAVLTQAADAISGSRPGARRESLEAYVERMQRLEEIASSHEGVDKVYAMQAGREVRVMVRPDEIDDLGAHALAGAIAKQVESALSYPGQIRITVVRESRATELAH